MHERAWTGISGVSGSDTALAASQYGRTRHSPAVHDSTQPCMDLHRLIKTNPL